mmetsp:Transcript_11542/g.32748  ORF Transcript_11542/g.32748 Transcript_11542/m.32748 type:complete len:129 (+) Transcript_11542:158-544(+)
MTTGRRMFCRMFCNHVCAILFVAGLSVLLAQSDVVGAMTDNEGSKDQNRGLMFELVRFVDTSMEANPMLAPYVGPDVVGTVVAAILLSPVMAAISLFYCYFHCCRSRSKKKQPTAPQAALPENTEKTD